MEFLWVGVGGSGLGLWVVWFEMDTFLKETEMSRFGPADEIMEDLGVGGALFRLELDDRPEIEIFN